MTKDALEYGKVARIYVAGRTEIIPLTIMNSRVNLEILRVMIECRRNPGQGRMARRARVRKT